jgi:hypothetical protein
MYSAGLGESWTLGSGAGYGAVSEARAIRLHRDGPLGWNRKGGTA